MFLLRPQKSDIFKVETFLEREKALSLPPFCPSAACPFCSFFALKATKVSSFCPIRELDTTYNMENAMNWCIEKLLSLSKLAFYILYDPLSEY